jgi:hypothetical protein
MAVVDFDEAATVVWHDNAVRLGDIANGFGDVRHFEHMGEALEFLFSALPEDKRTTAQINTSGHVYHYSDLVRIRDQRRLTGRASRQEYS